MEKFIKRIKSNSTGEIYWGIFVKNSRDSFSMYSSSFTYKEAKRQFLDIVGNEFVGLLYEANEWDWISGYTFVRLWQIVK
jgi:hypothetical protein